jgi:hypothetical protein
MGVIGPAAQSCYAGLSVWGSIYLGHRITILAHFPRVRLTLFGE